jgi:hypothetical protein
LGDRCGLLGSLAMCQSMPVAVCVLFGRQLLVFSGHLLRWGRTRICFGGQVRDTVLIV